ncbi:acetyl-CoA carboxylase family protein [Pseudonocardia sp. GCM10023141]|uniref:acetyl-CoA carboxylase family protein n=1 Tax=Pseudonocardia sp. GCM10023141 TaxID=3252653 RepID=UPI0036182541
MPVSRVLVANRGEIALRIADAAAEQRVEAVRVRAADEPGDAEPLPGRGPTAYLDGAALIAVARRTGCDAVHPGYGFLSESATFATACLDAGLVWVGPTPELLALFGDKAAARAHAMRCDVPVPAGTDGAVDVEGALKFAATTGGPVLIKAVAGGGGRGMRVVGRGDDLAAAFERCRSEAVAAFGDGTLYVEELRTGARHIEVQLAGDGSRVVALGDRDCSVQRRHQKLVEIAPAALADGARSALHAAAVRLTAGLRGVATAEFLVDAAGFVFLEVNPRIQVEHTVTEEVTGLDLVALQLRLAGGAPLDVAPVPPRGTSIQLRVNAETLAADGSLRPGAGTLERFAPPTGRGVRVDTAAAVGAVVDPRFDSLLAKLIITGADRAATIAHAVRALAGFDVAGVATNRDLLAAILAHPTFTAGEATTTFVDEHREALLGASPGSQDGGHPSVGSQDGHHPAIPEGAVAVRAPLAGVVVAVGSEPGVVAVGSEPGVVAVLESMKMEHPVTGAGRVLQLRVAVGDVVAEGDVLAVLEPGTEADAAAAADVDLGHIRPDLAEVLDRRAGTRDAARPDAVARRRRTGQRTARENIDDLCDPGTFTEFGALLIAGQRRRRSVEDLIARTPADGLVGGIGAIDGRRCVVASYDYTVLAGTQGMQNHRKTDRLIELAHRQKLPFVLFAEGGGGRPGDTDHSTISGLELTTFAGFARLSGTVPVVAIVSGYCFAGNAALAGCADVIIATEGSSLGMGGPAMIEGGGLGVFPPGEVGPMDVQSRNGVVDVLVPDEAAAVAAAKRYLGLVTGTPGDGACADQRALRHLVPENRLRAYDVATVIETLADSGSVLELRPAFGVGIRTVLARISGRAVGIMANDPRHLGGAIDADAADKAARFVQLCDAHGLGIVSLCDTPGFMVGPASERTATVRHFSRLFVAAANAAVPLVCVVLRKGYGLGAMAMAGGGFTEPVITVAWPTGEFGGMGLEGAVRLGYRAELDALPDDSARERHYRELVAQLYERGKALSTATVMEIDDVIDPAGTRQVIDAALSAAAVVPAGRRPFIDTW